MKILLGIEIQNAGTTPSKSNKLRNVDTVPLERKRRRSDSVLLQKPFTNRKFENQWTTQNHQQKRRLHNDCGPTKDGQLE